MDDLQLEWLRALGYAVTLYGEDLSGGPLMSSRRYIYRLLYLEYNALCTEYRVLWGLFHETKNKNPQNLVMFETLICSSPSKLSSGLSLPKRTRHFSGVGQCRSTNGEEPQARG